MYRKICIAVLSVLFLVPAVLAAVPGQMNFQGVLKGSAGNNITGAKKMTFAIYTAATGGTAVWTEVQNSVSVEAGLYSVQLGSATTMPSNIFDGSIKYLGVAVDPDTEMTPRVVLAAMPYAFRADYTTTSETIADGTVATPQIADLAVTSTKIASNAVTSVQIADNAVATGKILAGAVVKDKIGAVNAPIGGQVLTWNGSELQWLSTGETGTVTRVDTGAGLTGGPITGTGMIDVADGGITGAKLDPSVYATASTPNTLVSRDASGTFSASRIWVGTGEADSAGSKLIIYGDDSSGVRTTVRNIHINGKAVFRTTNDTGTSGAFGMYGSSVTGGYPPNYMFINNNTVTGGIAFITGGDTAINEAMRITSDRNVGIGTSAAVSILTVAGTIETISGGIKYPDGTTQITAFIPGKYSILETTAEGLTLFGGQAIKPSVDSTTAWGFSSSAAPTVNWLNVDTTNKLIQVNGAGTGATTPLSQIEITDDVSNPFSGLTVANHGSGSGEGANVFHQRSNGPKSVPTAVGDQWSVGALWGLPYDGTKYKTPDGAGTCGIGYVTNGTIATGIVPTDFVVATDPAANSTLPMSAKFRVTSAGRVGIQNSAPAQLLEVGRSTYQNPAYVRATSALSQEAGFSWVNVTSEVWHLFKPGDGTADLKLNNGSDVTVMRFKQNGLIAIGSTEPAAQLHQDAGTGVATYHKFTAGTTTGQGTFDGFDVGINGSGNAELRQLGNRPMNFYANNTTALTLEADQAATFTGTVGAVSYNAGGTPPAANRVLYFRNDGATPGQLTSITITGGIITGVTTIPTP